jgi:hypothetical protein
MKISRAKLVHAPGQRGRIRAGIEKKKGKEKVRGRNF